MKKEEKLLLTEDDMIALIEAFDEYARSEGYGPYLHWTDIEGSGESVCIVEVPKFCEYMVFKEEDFDLLFERVYAKGHMNLKEWGNYIKDTFEEAGVDIKLIARYEEYLMMLKKEVTEDEML